MSTKNIAYVTRATYRDSVDEVLFLLEILHQEGLITFEHFLEVPNIKGIFDGIVVLGFGSIRWDKKFIDIISTIKDIPCIYIYTLENPNIPGVTSIEAPFSFENLEKVFLETFRLGRR